MHGKPASAPGLTRNAPAWAKSLPRVVNGNATTVNVTAGASAKGTP